MLQLAFVDIVEDLMLEHQGLLTVLFVSDIILTSRTEQYSPSKC